MGGVQTTQSITALDVNSKSSITSSISIPDYVDLDADVHVQQTSITCCSTSLQKTTSPLASVFQTGRCTSRASCYSENIVHVKDAPPKLPLINLSALLIQHNGLRGSIVHLCASYYCTPSIHISSLSAADQFSLRLNQHPTNLPLVIQGISFESPKLPQSYFFDAFVNLQHLQASKPCTNPSSNPELLKFSLWALMSLQNYNQRLFPGPSTTSTAVH